MKKILYSNILTLLFSCQIANAQVNSGQLFLDGNNAFRNEKYIEAIRIYESIIDDGSISQDLYANLGTAHLKAGNIAKAILNFEKSLLIDPRNNAALRNLVLAKEKIENPIYIIPDFILVTLWRSFVNLFTAVTWLYLHAFFLSIALLMTVFAWNDIPFRFLSLIRKWKASVPIAIVSFFLSFFMLFLCFRRIEQVRNINYGLLMQTSSLRTGADSRSTELSQISVGSKLRILDQINEWYKVQLEDKDEGWIQISYVELIRINPEKG